MGRVSQARPNGGLLWGDLAMGVSTGVKSGSRHVPAMTFDVTNMVKTATVKDVPINNDALLNIQAY